MNRRLRTYAYAGLLAVLPATGQADDRWEAGTYRTDDDCNTINEIVHGSVQRGHDLQGASDTDWMAVKVDGAALLRSARQLGHGGVESGVMQQLRSVRSRRLHGRGAHPRRRRRYVRHFLQDAGGALDREHGRQRVLARRRPEHPFAHDMYDVELYDTTYFMPRFNNTSTQLTILLIQNTRDSLVTGEIYFYNGSGALLSTQPLSIPAQGVHVLNSATIPALAGQSGSVTIAQLGGSGALVGKAVALEPATGFTFDTAFTSLPR